MTRSGLTPDDFAPYLQLIEQRGLRHFLEGGQAVNAWANFHAVQSSPRLDGLGPFTSKDCDIWVSYDLFQQIESLLPGSLRKADSPADGQLGIFTTNDVPPKVIDLLDGVFGLDEKEVARVFERSMVVNGIRLIDPIYLLKSKCHNLVQLPQYGRNDSRHISILFAILPAHFGYLLHACIEGEITERQVLEEMKLLRSFKKDQWVRQALSRLGRSLDEALPLDLLRSCGLPKIERYAGGRPET
jgi:hypothetical protein